MYTEIERKFLVSGEFLKDAEEDTEIVQGYLSRAPERTVRVRIKGDTGYLTIKGKTSDSGTTRLEWEKEISAEEARELLMLCEPFPVFKTRYLVPFAGHAFEVDVFHEKNEGLVLPRLNLVQRMKRSKNLSGLEKRLPVISDITIHIFLLNPINSGNGEEKPV